MKMEVVCVLCEFVGLQGGPYRKRQHQIPLPEAQYLCTKMSSTGRRWRGIKTLRRGRLFPEQASSLARAKLGRFEIHPRCLEDPAVQPVPHTLFVCRTHYFDNQTCDEEHGQIRAGCPIMPLDFLFRQSAT